MDLNIKEEPPVHYVLILPPRSETEDHQREVDELQESDFAAQHYELENPQTEEQKPSLQYPQALQSNNFSDDSPQTVSSIKEETAVEYVLNLPPRSDDNPFGIKQCSVNLQQFDAGWKREASSSETFKACERCDLVTRSKKTFQDHKKGCRQELKCSYCDKKFSDKRRSHKNAKPVKCQPCQVEFKCRSLWNEHKQQHHQEGFRCDLCDFIGKSKKSFAQHYQSHSKKFSCETCGRRFGRNDYLKRHQMQHRHGAFATSELSFGCNQCEKTYRTKYGLSEHKFRSHQDKNMKCECDFCGGILKDKWIMKHHLETHIEEECNFCDKMIIKSTMPKHVNSEHIKSERSMSCNDCGKRFLHKKNFKKHINAKPMNCPSCQISFKCRNFWKQHQKEQHLDGFKCIQCSYVAKLPESLRKHLKSHTKEFSCVSCHKKFAHKYRLDDHQKNRKHGVFANTEVDALPCDKCEKVFRTARGLKDHKKCHDATRNVECDFCGRISNRKRNLIGHFKTHIVE